MSLEIKPGHDQSAHAVRFEWGPTGARAVRADLAVVVDVLSFTTTLTVALERGMRVFPYRWRDETAREYAAARDAVLAVGRLEAREQAGQVSLSPAAMAQAEGIERVVLPSPNGSTIAHLLAGSGARVVAACLRNADAVARWLAPQVAAGASCVVVAAGERWPDDTLRPSVEDLWGAGAVLARLAELTEPTGLPGSGLGPEARVAARAFASADLPAELVDCASGRELVAAGFGDDVGIAGEVGVSDVVPVLDGESFAPAR